MTKHIRPPITALAIAIAVFLIPASAILGVQLTGGASKTPASDTLLGWATAFFESYSRFDGTHLDHYTEHVQLVDTTAPMTLTSLAALRALFQQTSTTYEEVAFDLDALAIDTSTGNDATQTGTVVARGRIRGVLLAKKFDVPFTTWLEVDQGKVHHQIDFVDYAALQKQVRPPRPDETAPKVRDR